MIACQFGSLCQINLRNGMYPPMTIEENKQFMGHFIEEVINQKNLEAIDEMVAENFVEEIPFPGQGPGREGLKTAVTALMTGFPDLHWVVDEQVAEGETVVTRFTMTGTHQGEFMGIPATGKSINVWGVVIDVVTNGQFARSRLIMDSVGLLVQLGVIPGPPSA
jgi:steroid delta-isomerase-like uncharacterized protein